MVGSRSDPSAIACEETGRHVIVTVVPGSSDRGPWLLARLAGCLASRGSSPHARLAPRQAKSIGHRMCDVTDDCGARVGADHRSASYSLPYNSCNFVTLTAVLRASSRRLLSPVCAHDRSGRAGRVDAEQQRAQRMSHHGHHVKPKQFLPRLSYKIKLPMLPQICTPQCKALEKFKFFRTRPE